MKAVLSLLAITSKQAAALRTHWNGRKWTVELGKIDSPDRI